MGLIDICECGYQTVKLHLYLSLFINILCNSHPLLLRHHMTVIVLFVNKGSLEFSLMETETWLYYGSLNLFSRPKLPLEL